MTRRRRPSHLDSYRSNLFRFARNDGFDGEGISKW